MIFFQGSKYSPSCCFSLGYLARLWLCLTSLFEMDIHVVVGGGAKQNTHHFSYYMPQSAHFSLLSAAKWNLTKAQSKLKSSLKSSARAAGERTSTSNLCHATASLTRTHSSGGFAGRSSKEWRSNTLNRGRSRRTTTRGSGEKQTSSSFFLFIFLLGFICQMQVYHIIIITSSS